MRVTNNMIAGNTKSNINGNKVLVDRYNTQMTTQKKIAKASEDPVIAIRSLRLATSLTHIDQYKDNNIPDAEAWLDVTETALTNMKTILTDVRTQCVNGSTDTLTANDRQAILKSLTALEKQVYTEGNADYAGRTVFTGYRTDSKLTFMDAATDTTYNITQELSYMDLEEHRYYSEGVKVPPVLKDDTPDCSTDVKKTEYQRIRLAYKGISDGLSLTLKDSAGAERDLPVKTYDNIVDWQASDADRVVGDNDVIFLKDTGELVFGNEIAKSIATNRMDVIVNYDKTGFEAEDARPEYYYDCQNTTDPGNVINFKKEQQDINYTIAKSIELTVNTQADVVMDTGIKRDVEELIDVVTNAINAHDKVDRIKEMMAEARYADSESQAKLKTYLDAAKKEADYADDHLQKTFGHSITRFENHLQTINTAITNVGSSMSRLEMTKNRVENQQTTFEELKSKNEDREISDIIIDYTAAYNAYQASLTAASKINQQTLLNYI